MQDLVNTIRNYVCRDGLDASKVADIAANGPDLINLLTLLPGENPEKFRLIDDLQDYLEASEGKRRSGEQRTLAYYQTYFRFDAILQDFWQTASQERWRRNLPQSGVMIRTEKLCRSRWRSTARNRIFGCVIKDTSGKPSPITGQMVRDVRIVNRTV